MKFSAALLATFVFGLSVSAQAEKIEDNSFLVEEAYNQEPGVIQHIFTWQKKTEGAWDASFTEEVPVGSQSHQLSATVPYSRTADPAGHSGLGDVLLNYRYQWLANDIAAVAPRLSVVFPSGDTDKGLGVGATGLQMNLPVSVSINEQWVTHVNVVWSYLADAKNTTGQKATNTSVSFGGSVIYLMSETFNLMFEMVGSGKKSYAQAVRVLPAEVLARYTSIRRMANVTPPIVASSVPVAHAHEGVGKRFGVAIAFVLLLILFTLAVSIVLKPRGHDMPAELSSVTVPELPAS